MDHRANRPTPARVALGLFIFWQLWFLCSSNFLGLFARPGADNDELSDSRGSPALAAEPGVAGSLVAAVDFLNQQWMYKTGQVQAWWLFAPDFPRQSTFPLVELSWADDPVPVRLRSELEPDNLLSYFRFIPSHDRLFHYEVRLGLVYLGWDEESFGRQRDDWRIAIEHRVRRQWKSIRAYLRWRTERYLALHPGRAQPAEVQLWFRIHATPNRNGETSGGPREVVHARWFPHEPERVDAYDPVRGQFVKVAPP